MKAIDLVTEHEEPAEKIVALVEQMEADALKAQATNYRNISNLFETGRLKGKSQAFHEVLEMIRTGKILENEYT